jgi:hypothetical protein
MFCSYLTDCNKIYSLVSSVVKNEDTHRSDTIFLDRYLFLAVPKGKITPLQARLWPKVG